MKGYLYLVVRRIKCIHIADYGSVPLLSAPNCQYCFPVIYIIHNFVLFFFQRGHTPMTVLTSNA